LFYSPVDSQIARKLRTQYVDGIYIASKQAFIEVGAKMAE